MFTDMNQKNKAVENSIDGLEQLNDLSVMGFFMSLHIKSYEGISWFSFFDKLKAPRVKAFVKGLGTEQKVIITFDNDIIAHLCTTEQKMQMVTSAVVYNEEKWNYALNYLLSFISDYQRDCSIVKETQENKLFHSAEPYSGERTLSVLTQAILEEMGVTNQQHELIRFNTSLYDLKLPRIDIKTEFCGHYSNEYASVYFDGEKIGQIISEVVKYSGGYEERQFFTSDREKWNEMISYIISNIKYEKRLNFVFVVENEMV